MKGLRLKSFIWLLLCASLATAALVLLRWNQGFDAETSLAGASPELMALASKILPDKECRDYGAYFRELGDLDDPCAPALAIEVARRAMAYDRAISDCGVGGLDRIDLFLLDIDGKARSLLAAFFGAKDAQPPKEAPQQIFYGSESAACECLGKFKGRAAEDFLLSKLERGADASNCLPLSGLAESAAPSGSSIRTLERLLLSGRMRGLEETGLSALASWSPSSAYKALLNLRKKAPGVFAFHLIEPELIACGASFQELKSFLQDPFMRVNAISALGYYGDGEIPSMLAKLAESSGRDGKLALCQAFYRRRDLKDLPLLRKLAQDASPEVRAHALSVIASFRVRFGEDELKAMLECADLSPLFAECFRDSALGEGPEAEDALWRIHKISRSFKSSGNSDLAEEALRRIWSSRLLDELSELAASGEPRLAFGEISKLAAYAKTPERKADALRRFGPFLRSLKAACESPSPRSNSFRDIPIWELAGCLAEFGDLSRLDECRQALRSVSPNAPERAVFAKRALEAGVREDWDILLRDISSSEKRELAALPLPDPSFPAARSYACESARKILGPKLLAFAASQDEPLRMAAFRELGRLGEISSALEALRTPTRSVGLKDAALVALAEAGDPGSVGCVIKAYEDAKNGISPSAQHPNQRLRYCFSALGSIAAKAKPGDPAREKALCVARRVLESGAREEKAELACVLQVWPYDEELAKLAETQMLARREPGAMPFFRRYLGKAPESPK